MSERAIFAGGCFWCMIQPFDQLPGILSITSGYTGGHVVNPTYEEVLSHTTGHTEAVEILFDPEQMSYEQLVAIYWQQTDPTDVMGQFEDRGDNYRPVIFYTNDHQKNIAEKSKTSYKLVDVLINRLLQRLSRHNSFILQRNTIKIFIAKNRNVTKKHMKEEPNL